MSRLRKEANSAPGQPPLAFLLTPSPKYDTLVTMTTQMIKKLQPGDVMSVRDAAREIGVHYVTVYRWVRERKIVYITFGGSIFIPALEVERLTRERSNKALPKSSG